MQIIDINFPVKRILSFKLINMSCRYAPRNADFTIPRFNTVHVTHGKHNLSYLGPKLWAKLNKTLESQKLLTNLKVG